MKYFYKKLLDIMPDKPILIGRDKNLKSAVFVPFVNIDGIEYVLFEKRAPDIRQGGEICFPGGMLEEDEAPKITALRETVEELGIPEEKIEIQNHFGYLVANMGATLDVFIGTIKIDCFSQLTPDKKEVEEICPVPFSFFVNTKPDTYLLEAEIKSRYSDDSGNEKVFFPAKELGLPEKYHFSWPPKKVTTYVYNYEGVIIWGLTAEIIRELARYLEKGTKNE
ncbi:MAG: CoA pyrophosphatase [Spirochaetes bacterium]|nr:CoA pyrophosphatase [Spirochaetota bacterium]